MLTVCDHDLISLEAYEAQRPAYRAAMLALKRRRRLCLGPATLCFENTSTVLYQVLEVLRVEAPYRYVNVAVELAQYNVLVPRDGELRATLLVEGQVGPGPVTELLPRLCGGLSLQLGEREVRAELLDAEPVGWVGYVRFSVKENATRALVDTAEPALACVSSPGCSCLVALPAELRSELALDLDGQDSGVRPLGAWSAAAE